MRLGFFGRPHWRPIHAVDTVIQAAGVTKIVTGAVPTPQGRHAGTAIDAFFDIHLSQLRAVFL